MGVIEITSYIVTALIGGVALLKTFNDSRKDLSAIIVNIMLGGTIFVFLNIVGYSIALNFITGGIIVFLGIPGMILIVLLKIIFGIF